MTGIGSRRGANRIDTQLLRELVQLLAIDGVRGRHLGHVPDFIWRYPIATMRSIGSRARAAISAGTLTLNFISRRASRSFGSVIIFMYLQ